MSYKITTREKLEIIVPTEAGESLKEHILSLKKPQPIEIAGDMYLSSQIVSITKVNLDPKPIMGQSALPMAPKYNCAKYSIHRAIMLYASKNRETKKLKDESYRERIRLALREKYPDRSWCDAREGEHACLENVSV